MKNYILMKPTHMASKIKSTGARRKSKAAGPAAPQPAPAPCATPPRKEPHDATGASGMEGGKARVIHLGIDVHLRQYVVSRQIDGTTPQPAQRFTPEAFKDWLARQQTLAARVVCCYEAGPFGYGLYRHMQRTGVDCLVVRPQNWDTFGQKVKTDERDARALVEALARYEAGNKHALALVRVPGEEQEQRRALTRQRETFVREVRRLGAWGKGTALTHGHEMGGRWWRPKAWKRWQAKLPAWLVDLLDPVRQVLEQMDGHIARATTRIEALAQASRLRPKGLGALTEQIIANEVIDWHRFSNRRQVASYTGLCPSEHSSGGSRRQGSINRHGNPRLRHALVEAVWRLLRYQPGWHRFQRLKDRLATGASTPSVRKKFIVALARELAIDLWRLNTGRATLEDLGLQAATGPEDSDEALDASPGAGHEQPGVED